MLSLSSSLSLSFPSSAAIFHGRFLSPLPYKLPIKVLIGNPIRVDPKHRPKKKGGKPDEKIVDMYHQKYIEALKVLHKKEGGGRALEVR